VTDGRRDRQTDTARLQRPRFLHDAFCARCSAALKWQIVRLITKHGEQAGGSPQRESKAKWNWAKAVASMRRPRIQLQAWADDGPACNKQLPMSKRQWISCRETSYSRQPSATKYTTALQHWSPRKFPHASALECGTDMFIWSTMSTQHKHTDQILYSRQTRWGETSYRVYHAPTLGEATVSQE